MLFNFFFEKEKKRFQNLGIFTAQKIIEELRLFSNIIFKHYLKLFYSFFVGLKEFLHRHMTKGGNCTGECIEQMKQKMKFDIEARVCVLVTNADFLLSLQGDHVIQPLDKMHFCKNPYLALSCSVF